MTEREEVFEARFNSDPSATIQTTVGELIEALTQVAIEAGNSEREGYHLASLALDDLLRRRQREKRITRVVKKL